MIDDEVARLIKRVQQDKARARLVAIGMPAVQPIIDEIRTQSQSSWLLSTVLLQIRDPDIVPIFIDLLKDDNTDLTIMAFKGLGDSADQRALQPLLDQLLDPTNLAANRSMAAESLGDLGDERGTKGLLATAKEILRDPNVSRVINRSPPTGDENLDESLLLVVLSVIRALAKLGNNELASFATSLVHYSGVDSYSDDQIIRTQAAKTLKHAVSANILSALEAALHDEYYEVRLQAIDAIFYLGVKQSISALIPCLKDENPTVRNNALVRLRDLIGERNDHEVSVKKLKAWWDEHHAEFANAICYRMGKPIWLPRVIDLLETEPNRRNEIVEELRIITGNSFGLSRHIPFEDQNSDGLLERVQIWWKKEGNRFEAGSLYKYGRKQELRSFV